MTSAINCNGAIDGCAQSSVKPRPFLKWAGGKRWFADNHLTLIPREFGTYVEPFLGSAALYFALQPARALLADVNSELIACYLAVRSQPAAVAAALAAHHERHCKSHYYVTRATKPADAVALAARLIYLNRTCWNGLYRVNRRNQFNVPMGTKTNVLLPSDDFDQVSRTLHRAVILCQDFEVTIDAAADGDFVFVDPPYTVKHNFNGFLKYNDTIFSWLDQIRLRDAVARAKKRGCQVVITNANHESIREIYKGIGEQVVLERSSVLSANPRHRSQVEELVIRTWK